MTLCGLDRTAVLCQLAERIYTLTATFYGVIVPPFEQLSFEERHRYVELAQDVLGRLKPESRPTWPEDLFQQVVDVARAEGARVLGFRGQDTSDGRD